MWSVSHLWEATSGAEEGPPESDWQALLLRWHWAVCLRLWILDRGRFHVPTPASVPFDHVISISPSPSLLILLQVQINSGALWWISIQVLHFSAAAFLSDSLC